MYKEGGFINNNKDTIYQGRKTEKDRQIDTVTPLLIRWMKQIMKMSTDDINKANNTILDKIKIVGRITSYSNQGTKAVIGLDDGSDFIEISCNKKFDQEVSPILEGIDFSK